MKNYEGNSNASKKPKEEIVNKNIEPVTTNVKVKNENSLAKKFFAQDLNSTMRGVTNDIVIPGVKNLIVNVLKKAVDYLFLGNYGSNSNYTNYNYYGQNVPRNVSFSSNFNPSQGLQGPAMPNPIRSSVYTANDIIFNDRGDAEEVLMRMNEVILRYGMVSVADYYDFIQHKSNYTDNKFGWKDLSGASVIRSVEGYRIAFPKITPLE